MKDLKIPDGIYQNAEETYNECELLPSELLKQNKELREALEEIYHKGSINLGKARELISKALKP